MSEETVTFNLELNVEQAFDASRQLETLAYRGLGQWARVCKVLGLPEDSPYIVVARKLQDLAQVIRLFHTSAILLESATTPIGLAKAGLGLAAVVTSVFMMRAGE